MVFINDKNKKKKSRANIFEKYNNKFSKKSQNDFNERIKYENVKIVERMKQIFNMNK